MKKHFEGIKMKRIRNFLLISILAMLLQLGASAASVTWQSVRAVADSADVDTNGTSVLATYWSGVASTNPINGVTFKDSGTAATTQNGVTATVGNFGSGSYGFYANYFFNNHFPDTMGDGPGGANYAALLEVGVGVPNNASSHCSSFTLSLAGLTVGRNYRVQFWVYDDRYQTGPTETISGSGSDINIPTMGLRNAASPNIILSYNCNGGSFVIGSFTATSSTQTFTITDASATGIQLNGFQLRDVTGVTVPLPAPRSPVMAMGTGGTVGSAFSYSIVCFVNATNYSASNLPAGLSLNSSTGVISGTPCDSGISHATISGIVAGVTYQATLIIAISQQDGTPLLSTDIPRGYLNNVPESINYSLVYSLNIPWTCNFNSLAPPYGVDVHTNVAPFTRVAYYLELQAPNGTLQYVWVSMNAFTTNAGQIGVPTSTSGASFQQVVTNLNVISDVSGVLTGTGLSGSLNFSSSNNGAMVVSNSSGIFGFTNWGGNGGYASVGMTNYLAATNYSVRSLQVLVLNSASNMTIQPVADNSLLINPGKGYAEYWGPTLQYTPTVIGVGYNRCNWNTLETAEGVYDWSWVDNYINNFAQYGKKFAFGVINHGGTPQWVFAPGTNVQTGQIYTNGAVSNPSETNSPLSYDDPVYIARTKDFIKAFGARYNGNPNIAYLDMRDVGIWGEGNAALDQLSAGSTLTNFYQPYVDAFPNTQLIEDVWYGSVASALVSQGTGARTDGICSGTMSGGNGVMNLFAYPYQPSIMEYWGSSAPTNVYRGGVMNELMIYIAGGRPSYLQFNGDLQYPNFTNFYNMVGNLMGYHFVLQQASIPKTIQAGVPFSFNWTWFNDGVAPLYEPCSVALALLDTNNNVVSQQWLSGSNPNGWMPGGGTAESFTNVIFNSVPTGCKLAVGLFVKQTDANPTYKVGIQGRTYTGWYTLSGNWNPPQVGVTWQSVQTPVSSTDVATNGISVLATYWSGVSSSKTINGVTFADSGVGTQTQNGIVASQFGTGWWNISGANNTFYSGAHSITGPDAANYKAVLGDGAWGGAANSSAAINLNGLTAGHQYLVQFWVWDDRSNTGNYTETISSGGSDVNAPILIRRNSTGGVFVIGTFTASDSLQSYTITDTSGGGIQLNAFQLRDVSGPVPPNAPFLSAVLTNTQIAVQWNYQIGVSGYNIKRSTTSGSGYTTIASNVPGTSTSYVDTNVIAGGTYYYVASATNAFGVSADSAEVSVQMPNAPNAPILSAVFTNGQIAIQWNYQIGVSGYNIKRSTTSGSGYTTIAANVSGTSYQDANVTGGATYYYVASATNAFGVSANSAEVSVKIPGQPNSVIWQNAKNIAGSDDVATNGTAVLATYLDKNNPGSYAVNSVIFTNNGTLTTTTNGVTAALTGNWNVFEGTANGQAGNYGTILNGSAWGGAIQTLALSGLTVGAQYLVQFWEVDGRGVHASQTMIFAAGSDINAQTLTYGGSSNPGQCVTGTFTAGSSTMSFTLTNVAGEIDTAAFQLRNVTGVTSVSVNPTNLAIILSNNVLQLTWPADHTGWRLLVQTNHLNTGISLNTNDWATIPGSTQVNQTNFPVILNQPMEFYRLVYP
jgi:hypothetical protein